MLNLLNIVTFRELKKNSAFLKNAACAFEARDLLNMTGGWGGWRVEAYFLINMFLIKKTCKVYKKCPHVSWCLFDIFKISFKILYCSNCSMQLSSMQNTFREAYKSQKYIH